MSEYVHPDDRFCVYCQVQYKSHIGFLKHVRKEHLGVYHYLRVEPVHRDLALALERRNPL